MNYIMKRDAHEYVFEFILVLIIITSILNYSGKIKIEQNLMYILISLSVYGVYKICSKTSTEGFTVGSDVAFDKESFKNLNAIVNALATKNEFEFPGNLTISGSLRVKGDGETDKKPSLQIDGNSVMDKTLIIKNTGQKSWTPKYNKMTSINSMRLSEPESVSNSFYTQSDATKPTKTTEEVGTDKWYKNMFGDKPTQAEYTKRDKMVKENKENMLEEVKELNAGMTREEMIRLGCNPDYGCYEAPPEMFTGSRHIEGLEGSNPGSDSGLPGLTVIGGISSQGNVDINEKLVVRNDAELMNNANVHKEVNVKKDLNVFGNALVKDSVRTTNAYSDSLVSYGINGTEITGKDINSNTIRTNKISNDNIGVPDGFKIYHENDWTKSIGINSNGVSVGDNALYFHNGMSAIGVGTRHNQSQPALLVSHKDVQGEVNGIYIHSASSKQNVSTIKRDLCDGENLCEIPSKLTLMSARGQ